ncbi:MAG: hypothetical protein AB7E79_05590 [Rhodospirillaceae bacterium]
MFMRAAVLVLACAYAVPLAAAGRPNVPVAPPGVAMRDLPSAAGAVRPAVRVAPSRGDLPRTTIVRPDNVVTRHLPPPSDVRPNLPIDGRPIIPILPGRPENRPAPPADSMRPLPIEGVRPPPMPIQRPVRPAN